MCYLRVLILEVFSSLTDSMILWSQGCFGTPSGGTEGRGSAGGALLEGFLPRKEIMMCCGSDLHAMEPSALCAPRWEVVPNPSALKLGCAAGVNADLVLGLTAARELRERCSLRCHRRFAWTCSRLQPGSEQGGVQAVGRKGVGSKRR